MKIVICDDDIKICELVGKILSDYSKVNHTFVHTDVFYSCEKLIESLDKGEKYSLIFLDIEFPGLNGINLGRYIREEKDDLHTEIVYMSGSDNYDRKLFNISPLLFMPKPFTKEDVLKAVELAYKRVGRNPVYFSFNYKNMIRRVDLNKTIYFRSDNRKIQIVTTVEDIEFYGKLDDVERNITGGKFIRISKSCLVNYNHIIELTNESVLISNNELLNISRNYKSRVKDFFVKEDMD